ncbi:MAG: rhodanese-like domain-containing protein [Saprospiraceae bacterium]|nr:rhodanese-like domain-containing protein [Saprospiraceae bacterium]
MSGPLKKLHWAKLVMPWLWISLNQILKKKAGQLDRNNTYIVYCAAGGRSSKAVAIMQDLGFDKAFNMVGGYTEWSKK